MKEIDSENNQYILDRIRIFKAQASPAYMALTYIKNPITHAFDCTKKAALGMIR